MATVLLDELHGAGVDLVRITDELELEGAQSFCGLIELSGERVR